MAEIRGIVPEVVTGVYILDKDDKLLLVKSPKWGERWMVPGGHVELGETVFDCAVREVKEEVGLDVKPEGVLVIAEDIFPKDFHRKAHFICMETICRALDESVIRLDGRETTDYRWFDLEEAVTLMNEPVIKRTISKYISGKKNGSLGYIDIKPVY